MATSPTVNSLVLPPRATKTLCFQTPFLLQIDYKEGGRNRRNPRTTSSSPVLAKAVAKFKGTAMREKHLAEMIEKKVMEATEVCEGKSYASDECKVAWDEVEEVSQAKADLRRKMESQQDPLQSFCDQNPETDECRIYED